mgnify:CR=1 FL=1
MNSNREITYHSIGIIHSPFKSVSGIPVQPTMGKGLEGTVEIFPEYCDALVDIEGFSHIVLIFHLHLSKGYSLRVVPYGESTLRGLFTTRSPRRPNPIGISIVRLAKVNDCILHIRDLDIVDGTPLLDIKPYIPFLDERHDAHIGWISQKAQKKR